MTDGQRLVLLIARMVDLLRSKPGGVDEAKEVLRSLTEMTTLRSWTLRLKGPEMSVEGVVVAMDTPPLPLLAGQMNAHGISEIQIAQGVSAASLMHLMRGLAIPPGGFQADDGIEKRLLDANVRRIHVLRPDDEVDPEKGQPQRVTDAVRMPGTSQSEEQGQSDSSAGHPRESRFISAAPPPSIDELIEQVRGGRAGFCKPGRRRG